MKYRVLDPVTGFRRFGHGLADFYVDVPEAVKQAVDTRLRLYTGDWKLDPSAGMPWRTEVLGKYTGSVRDPAIQSRILGTPGLLDFYNYASSLDRNPRTYTVTYSADTVYGTINNSVLNAASTAAMVDVRYGR